MKYSQILTGGILLALLLFLAACSTHPTPTQPVNSTPQDLGTGQEPANTTPPTQEVAVNTSTNTTGSDLTASKVSIDTIYAMGSKFNTKYLFNQIIINVTTTAPIEWDTVELTTENKYYNGTFTYNENISCSNAAEIIRYRNKQFGIQSSSTKTTICFSPGRDMQEQDVLDFVATYKDTAIITEELKIPAAATSSVLRLK